MNLQKITEHLQAIQAEIEKGKKNKNEYRYAILAESDVRSLLLWTHLMLTVRQDCFE